MIYIEKCFRTKTVVGKPRICACAVTQTFGQKYSRRLPPNPRARRGVWTRSRELNLDARAAYELV